MTITIEINDAVAQAIDQALAQQSGMGPSTLDEWLRNVLEHNIANLTLGRLRTQSVEEARAAAEAAQRALVRAASGITRLDISRG